jgi:hypothetical protein
MQSRQLSKLRSIRHVHQRITADRVGGRGRGHTWPPAGRPAGYATNILATPSLLGAFLCLQIPFVKPNSVPRSPERGCVRRRAPRPAPQKAAARTATGRKSLQCPARRPAAAALSANTLTVQCNPPPGRPPIHSYYTSPPPSSTSSHPSSAPATVPAARICLASLSAALSRKQTLLAGPIFCTRPNQTRPRARRSDTPCWTSRAQAN